MVRIPCYQFLMQVLVEAVYFEFRYGLNVFKVGY